MSTQSDASLVEDLPSEADITIDEYDEHGPIELTDPAITFLQQEVNGGTERDGDRIGLTFDRRRRATLKATSYVGVVSLPDGPTIEIQPKVDGTQLLHLLRYANGVESTTFEQETRLRRGNVFIEAIAQLFRSELSRVLTHGLYTDYRKRQSAEPRLRGRLDLQRQLQRQPPQPTRFECTYDELTPDVTINQAVLYATSVLLRLSDDTDTIRALQRHRQTLLRQVTLRPVDPFELERIEVTRLNEYYEDLLRFTKLIIGNINISELAAGDRSSFSLLVNMNTVFEKAVERAATEAVRGRAGWNVTGQDDSKDLLNSGRFSVTLKPDVTVRDGTATVRVVGDAKWKKETPKNDDFYQMAAYELAHDAPGLLVYPEQGADLVSEEYFPNGRRLDLIELPTATTDGFDAFCTAMAETMDTAIETVMS